jgi:hypothetical protein
MHPTSRQQRKAPNRHPFDEECPIAPPSPANSVRILISLVSLPATVINLSHPELPEKAAALFSNQHCHALAAQLPGHWDGGTHHASRRNPSDTATAWLQAQHTANLDSVPEQHSDAGAGCPSLTGCWLVATLTRCRHNETRRLIGQYSWKPSPKATISGGSETACSSNTIHLGRFECSMQPNCLGTQHQPCTKPGGTDQSRQHSVCGFNGASWRTSRASARRRPTTPILGFIIRLAGLFWSGVGTPLHSIKGDTDRIATTRKG